MSDTQNDDLQNAINGIVNGAADGAAPADGAATDTAATDAPADAAATPDLGVPPMPPMAPEDAPAEMQLPTMPVPDPAAGLMNAEPESIEEQAAEAAAPAPAEVPEPVAEVPEPVDGTLSETAVDSITETVEKMPASAEMSDVKKSMISDLIPLMDKVSLAPEKQFEFYKEIIDATHDKDMVPGAYNVAKKLSDDAARAEALLYLIEQSE